MGLEMFRLDGKVAWITGGVKGLGFAMAEALASAGAHIVINSRSGAEAQEAARRLTERHGRACIGMAADVTEPDQVQAVVDRAVAELGGVDILVNSAGINIRRATLEASLEDWTQVIDTNLTGAFITSQAAARVMVTRGWGRIIHMASMLGLVGLAERPAYTAAKGAVVQLARTQALEMATSGVTVNALCPGPFPTEINRPVLEDPRKYQFMATRIPMGRWGRMNELDGAVVFLASEASSYITGTTLVVDGGWTAQ